MVSDTNMFTYHYITQKILLIELHLFIKQLKCKERKRHLFLLTIHFMFNAIWLTFVQPCCLYK